MDQEENAAVVRVEGVQGIVGGADRETGAEAVQKTDVEADRETDDEAVRETGVEEEGEATVVAVADRVGVNVKRSRRSGNDPLAKSLKTGITVKMA